MKTSKKTTLIAGVALAFVILFSAVGSTSAAPASPTPFREVNNIADNGYKYPSVADSVTSALYQEWWYFEVTDFESGLFFTCWYEIDNPAGETLDGMEIPSASYVGCEGFYGDMMFAGGNPGDGINYPYTAETDSWNVDIGGNTIAATSLDTVEIVGYEVITGISWDLEFARQVLTGMYTDVAPTGYSPTDIMGWSCMLPLAMVIGTITIDGVDIPVSYVQGYSDHNWGSPEILSYAPWIKTVTEDIAIIGGGIPSPRAPNHASNGFINVWVQNQWVWFKVPNIRYTWAVDEATGMEYVSKFNILAMSLDNKWILNVESVLVGAYLYEVIDFGAYIVSFFKSFEFITTGTIRHLTFPDIFCPITVELPTTIEQNFIIPVA